MEHVTDLAQLAGRVAALEQLAADAYIQLRTLEEHVQRVLLIVGATVETLDAES